VSIQYDSEQLTAACRRLGVKLAVLFGSRAEGVRPPAADSDLDLAVLVARAHPPVTYGECYETLSPVFAGLNLDLVFLHAADPLLRYEIMSRGKMLFGDMDHFLEYRAFAYRDFVDSGDLRALEDALFRKKMAFLRSGAHGAD
jgi:uncharacterized protein